MKIKVYLICIYFALFIKYVKSLTTQNLSCTTTLGQLEKEIGDESNYVVACPSNCSLQQCYVVGTDVYTSRSGICCSGIHSGAISNDVGGMMKVSVFHKRKRNFPSSYKNGITSREFNHMWQHQFSPSVYTSGVLVETTNFERISTTTTAPVIASSTYRVKPTTFSEKIFVTNATSNSARLPEQHSQNTTVNQTVNTSHVSGTTPKPVLTLKTTRSEDLSTSTVASSNKKIYTVTSTNIQSDFASSVKDGSDKLVVADESTIEVSTKISPQNIRLENSTKLFTNDSPQLEVNTVSADKIAFWLVISVSIVIVVAIITLLSRRYLTHTSAWRRLSRRRQNNDCVCFVAIDSSVQGLLNDPETCERACHIREQMQEMRMTRCPTPTAPNCANCTGEKCDSKYDF